MKRRLEIIAYILVVSALSYTIFLVGCGKNPIGAVLNNAAGGGQTVGETSGNVTVEVIKM